MSKCFPLSEYSFHNTQVYVSKYTSFQQHDQIPLAPNMTSTYNQIIYPLNISHEMIAQKDPSYRSYDITPFQNSNNDSQNIGPNNIIINYTVINNYFPQAKKKKQVEVVNDVDETSETNESADDNNIKIDEFLSSVRLFVQHLEMSDGEQSILNPSIAFGISRRRLYDIVNVFESIGCCKKRRCDSIFWIGQSNIKNQFENLIQQRNLDNLSLSLEELFPAEKCIGVSNMTSSLILLFYALKTDKLDLRDVAFFFARQSPRYKTTLNKLYQIVHIMSSIELMKKTQQLGEVIISTGYFSYEVISENDYQKVDPGSIKSFLNTDKSKIIRAVQKRRNEFKQYVSSNRKR